ncbi:hypothetical protein [Serratia sp. D1N4]
MPIFTVGFEPKPKAVASGAVSMAVAIDAKNAKLAVMKAITLMEEEFPDSSDNFLKPKVCADRVGLPRPPIGQFSTHWMTEVFWNEETKEFNTLPTTTEEVPTGPVDLLKQPADIKITAIGMYGLSDVDHSCLSLVHDFRDSLNDEDAPDETGMRDVIKALISIPAVGAMYPEAINSLYEAIYTHFNGEVPTEPGARRFAEKWVNNPRDRDQLTSSSSKAGVMDYNTLSMHTMLSIMGVHPLQAKPSDVRNAKELMEQREPLWRAVDKTFRVITGILDVDTDTRHAIISDGLKNIQMFNDDQARLHFVKTRLAGNPACPELASYGQQETPSQPEVKNLGGGKFSVDGLVGDQQNTASNEVEKTEVATTNQVSDETAQQAKETLDQLGYGVYATETGDKSEHLQRAEKTLADVTELVTQLKADDFEQRANLLEQFFAEQQQSALDNLDIWNRVYKTDPKHTKAFANNGGGTSINGTYMVMQATKVFGPQGINWRVEVIEERFDDGAPIMRSVKQQDGNYLKEVIPNGAGGYLCEVNHTVRINLIFEHAGKKGVIPAYGCTPYIQSTKNGVVSDGEAPKKSLTDATKKALSQLGFSADVFLGLYDDVNYREENKAEFAVKNASDKAEGINRLREELDEKLTKVAETISKAVTINEASKVHGSIAREIEAYRKAAEAKGDTDHAKYLAGRLRRLTVLKDERIKALSTSEEKAQ